MSKYLAGSKLLCGWCVNYTSEEIQLFQITRQYSRSPPLAIVRTLLVQKDLSWKVYVGEHLAAQVSTYTLHYLIYTFMKVLSESVADAFVTLRTLGNMEVDTRATEEFVRVFDKFFDLFNTRSLDEGHFKLKPNLNAYYCTNDKRLQVITICNQ